MRFFLAAMLACFAVSGAQAGTVIEDWARAEVPAAPALKPVSVDPKTTAFLVLDLVRQGCNDQRRPRCLPTIPAVVSFLGRVRAAGMPVIYSLVAGSTAADILPGLQPVGGDAMVQSGTDKFLGTDLEKVLHDRGIRTVIVVGTAAHGAVMVTATEAALRGLAVVVAIDGVSADSVYAEQFAAWDLVNAPVIAGRVTLSRTDMIGF